MLTKRQWEQVRKLFAELKSLSDSQRSARLAQIAEPIHREVESLLEHHDKDRPLMGVPSSIGDRVLSHYQIHEQIGEGGMAFVYKALDLHLKRWVAIKALHPWAMSRTGSRERLMFEARCAASLNHPNIVTVYEVAEENDVCFIVMEYLTGKTLNRVVPPKGLAVSRAIAYATETGEALACAHKADIIHGDLKPANIMVASGRVKLLDFGLARMVAVLDGESEKGGPGRRFGTKAYMAPELLRDASRDPDERSDIFSFGLLVHEMLAGSHAFGTGTPEEVGYAILNKPPGMLPPRIPDSLAGVVRRCLEQSPEPRFQTMPELLSTLLNIDETKSGKRPPAVGLSGPSALGTGTGERYRSVSGMRRGDDAEQAQALLAQISYENVALSRRALLEIRRLLQDDVSPEIRDVVNADLRDLILTLDDFGGNVVPPLVRNMRKLALDVLRLSAEGRLGQCFHDRDFEYLDLYGMNFAFAQWAGFSFEGCFLPEADFRQSDLARGAFARASIRNVNFAEANLSGADFTDADWFNALGLTESQLASIELRTLRDCPPDVPGMYQYLDTRYRVPFDAWPVQAQEQLKAAWEEYLRPGGLRDKLVEWRRTNR